MEEAMRVRVGRGGVVPLLFVLDAAELCSRSANAASRCVRPLPFAYFPYLTLECGLENPPEQHAGLQRLHHGTRW